MLAAASSAFVGVSVSGGSCRRAAPVAVVAAPNCSHDFLGIVEGVNTAKTIRVRVKRSYAHEMYIKQLSVSKAFLVHDETGIAKLGDQVRIGPCKPVSKLKRMTLLEVTKPAGEKM